MYTNFRITQKSGYGEISRDDFKVTAEFLLYMAEDPEESIDTAHTAVVDVVSRLGEIKDKQLVVIPPLEETERSLLCIRSIRLLQLMDDIQSLHDLPVTSDQPNS